MGIQYITVDASAKLNSFYLEVNNKIDLLESKKFIFIFKVHHLCSLFLLKKIRVLNLAVKRLKSLVF